MTVKTWTYQNGRMTETGVRVPPYRVGGRPPSPPSCNPVSLCVSVVLGTASVAMLTLGILRVTPVMNPSCHQDFQISQEICGSPDSESIGLIVGGTVAGVLTVINSCWRRWCAKPNSESRPLLPIRVSTVNDPLIH